MKLTNSQKFAQAKTVSENQQPERRAMEQPSHKDLFAKVELVEHKVVSLEASVHNAVEHMAQWRADDHKRYAAMKDDIDSKLDALLGLMSVIGDNAKALSRR